MSHLDRGGLGSAAAADAACCSDTSGDGVGGAASSLLARSGSDSSATSLAPRGSDDPRPLDHGARDADATIGSAIVASHLDRGGLSSAAAADAAYCSDTSGDGVGGAAGTMLARRDAGSLEPG